MSRFSRKEAEAAGWRFVHQRDSYETVESSTQGRTTTTPSVIQAERYVSLPGQTATLVTETAETEGKLLERIAAYEAHLHGLPSAQPAPVDEDDEPRVIALGEDGEFNVTEEVAGTVLVPDGEDAEADPVRISDAAWSAAGRRDSLVIANEEGEAGSITYGGAREDVADAVDAVDDVRKRAEDLRSAEPHPGATKQIDSSGGRAELAVVRADEDSVEEATDRQDAERALIEDIRVTEAPIDHAARAPEDEDLIAGTDVGLQRRTDLESEQPGQGQTADSDAPPSIQEVIEDETPTTPATAGENAARSDAMEAEAKEQRDEGLANAAKPESEAEVRQAGIDAVTGDSEEPDAEPDTTDEDQENAREAGDPSPTAPAAADDSATQESQSTPSADEGPTGGTASSPASLSTDPASDEEKSAGGSAAQPTTLPADEHVSLEPGQKAEVKAQHPHGE